MTEFPIFFCESYNAASTAMQSRSVYVWPVDPNWNDFGYGYQAKARIGSARPDRPDLFITLLVIPRAGETDANRFDRWLKPLLPNDRVLRAATLGKRFFSILKNEKEYQDLVNWAYREEVKPSAILGPLRDVVFFRADLMETEALETFLSSEAAQRGVFRREPTFLAWHRAFHMLNGSNANDIDDARAEFSFETTLPGFSGPHAIRIRYGVPSPLNDRCHALIGVNGAGKTQFLRELIITLGQKIDGTGVDPFTSGANVRGADTSLSPDSFRVNRLLALSWDSQSAYPSAARLNSQFQYLHFTMHDDEFEPNERVSTSNSDALASQLIQLFREDAAGIGEGLKRLRATLKPLFDVSDLAVAVRPTGGAAGPVWLSLREIKSTFETRQLEIFSTIEANSQPKRWIDAQGPVELSSGERAFLSFGIRCAARVVAGTLLVLDEPETHLHPSLISDFMRVLSAMLESTKSVALIATHSPFVVRELPSRCVHVLRIDEDRTPLISSAFLRTFGASVDTLAADIFGDAESRQVNQDVAKKISESGMTFDEIRKLYGRELSSELLSEIRQLMREAIK